MPEVTQLGEQELEPGQGVGEKGRSTFPARAGLGAGWGQPGGLGNPCLDTGPLRQLRLIAKGKEESAGVRCVDEACRCEQQGGAAAVCPCAPFTGTATREL